MTNTKVVYKKDLTNIYFAFFKEKEYHIKPYWNFCVKLINIVYEQ